MNDFLDATLLEENSQLFRFNLLASSLFNRVEVVPAFLVKLVLDQGGAEYKSNLLFGLPDFYLAYHLFAYYISLFNVGHIQDAAMQ